MTPQYLQNMSSTSTFKPQNVHEAMAWKDLRNRRFRSQEEAEAFITQYTHAREEMLNCQLTEEMSEVILSGIMDKFFQRALKKAQSQDIYKREVKHTMLTVGKLVRDYTYRANRYERDFLLPLIANYMEGFINQYKNTGGVVNGMRYHYEQANGKLFDELYLIALKMFNASTKANHSDFLACMTVVDICAQVNKKMGERMYIDAKKAMAGFSDVHKPLTTNADAIHKMVGNLSNTMAGTLQDNFCQRQLTDQIRLIDDSLDDLSDLLARVATDTINDYVLFYVSYVVWLKQHDKFDKLARKLVKENIDYFDATGCLHARCCKDWKRLANTLPVYDDIEDTKDAVRVTTPKHINELIRRIASVRKQSIAL